MKNEGLEISDDQSHLDIDLIYGFLSQSYWAKDIPRELVETSLKNSLCIGFYEDGDQIAFARVVTDYATFAYLADVFVLPEHRGRGISKQLMKAVMNHPKLQGMRRFLLATKDAHSLYEQFGFQPLADPDKYMTIHKPDIYKKQI